MKEALKASDAECLLKMFGLEGQAVNSLAFKVSTGNVIGHNLLEFEYAKDQGREQRVLIYRSGKVQIPMSQAREMLALLGLAGNEPVSEMLIRVEAGGLAGAVITKLIPSPTSETMEAIGVIDIGSVKYWESTAPRLK